MFRSLPQSIQFHLLAFTDQAKPNFAVRLEDVVKVKQPEQAAIRLTFQIDASAASAGNVVAGAGTIPIQIELDGAASEINVPLSGDRIEGIDQLIPIDANQSRGWGRVALPADRNPGDNEFFFVYDDPQVRQTLVVSEDPQATEPLAIAASINANPAFSCRSETIRPETMVATPLDDVSLILWQASLPKADEAVVQNLISWAKRGGTIIFFPPQQPGDGVIAECSWQTWQDGVGVSSWVDDQDLLADTKAGESLPLGDLRIDRYCKLSGPQRILATLGDGSALLTRPSDFSSIENSTTGWPQEAKLYFFTTTASDSSLAKDGVVLFAIIHRALQRTSGLRDRTRIYSTSELRGADPTGWQRVAGATGMLSSGYHRHAGVFRDGDRLIAINRAEAEDRDRTLSDRQVASLFAGLPFDRVDTSTETASSLVREIWRLFLLLMLAALLIESVLSVPRDRHLFHAGERAAASTSTMRSF